MSRYKDKDLLKQRQEKAYKYFIDKGYTPAQSSGIVGNLIQESRLDPGIKSTFKNEGSFGIAQWNPGKAAGNRLGKLKEFAKQRGGHHADFDIQLSFIEHELNTTGYLGKNKLMNAKNAEEAAQIFSKYYERPNAKHANNEQRAAYAKNVYAMFNDKDTYAKDEKGQIVVLNPEVVTDEDKIKSPAIKREFYLAAYDIPQEKQVNVEAPPAVQKAKQDIEQTKREVAFKNQLGDALKQLDKRGEPATEKPQQRQTPQNQQFQVQQNEFYQQIMPQMEVGGETGTDPEKEQAKKVASSTNVRMPKTKGFSNLIPDKELNISLDDIMNPTPEEEPKDDVVDTILANADFNTKKELREIPTPAYGGFNINLNNSRNQKSFRAGDSGRDVEQIQQYLIKQGYMDSTTARGKSNVDGKFGAITSRALKKFQQAKGLTADGYLGKNTLNAMTSTRDRKVVDERMMNIKVQDGTATVKPLIKEFAPKKQEIKEEIIEGTFVRNGVERTTENGLVKPIKQNIARKAFNNIIPTSGRTLVNDITNQIFNQVTTGERAGKDDFSPITEEHFPEDQLNALNTLVTELLKRDKTAIKSYDDWRQYANMSGKSIEDDIHLDNPANVIGQTLGRANIDIDEYGNVFVEDRYNFNDASNDADNPTTYKELQEKRNMNPFEVPLGKAIYSIGRNTGGVFGSAEGEGALVSIFVGNLEELNLPEKQRAKLKKKYLRTQS